MILSTFWDVMAASFIIFFVFVPLIMLWVFALADLFGRRDIRWRKLVWLLVIIFLPLFGPLVYLLVRPEDEIVAASRQATVSEATIDTMDEAHYRPS
jgi:hypothetical protein